MNPYAVCWLEGAFVTPQHFQQQERFLTHYSSQYHRLVNPSGYGFASLKIDQILLAAGKFEIVEGSGIFPDMTPFVIDEPLVINVPEGTCDASVILTLPCQKYGSQVVGDASEFRYQFQAEDIIDCIKPDAPVARIEMARPNLGLSISDDPQAGLTHLHVARVTYIDNDGEVHLDNSFIPSALNLRVSRYVMDKLEELLGRLNQKSRLVTSRLEKGRTFKSEQSLWQDQLWSIILSQWKSGLELLMVQPFITPLELCKILFSMSGSLEPLSKEQAPEPVHLTPDTLSQVLPGVFRFLLSALDITSQEGVFELDVNDSWFAEQRILTVTFPIQQHSPQYRCILAIATDQEPAWLADNVPKFVTVAPESRLAVLLETAVPGFGLQPLSLPPVELNLSDCQAFLIDSQSQTWLEMLQNQENLAIHLDRQLGDPEVRLFMIQQG